MEPRPLILTGTGRCGSTALHEMLSHHPRLAWPAQCMKAHPRQGERNQRVMQGLDVPGLRRLVWRREYAHEVYPYWQHFYGGFSRPHRDLTAADVDTRTRERLRESFRAMVTPRRPDVLIKITGFSRIGFLHEIFPEARFIHLVRDGRPTALSDMAKPWCDVWKGADGWSWGALDDAQRSAYDASGESFHVLAAILWEKQIRSHWSGAEQAGLGDADYLELRYEDLCEAPEATLTRILAFAGLEWDPYFRRRFAGFTLRATNERWRSLVTGAQARQMTDAIAQTLAHYDYPLER